METKLERIAEISANTRKPKFTSLYHHINEEMLKQCHKELDGNKAVGIDRVTKVEYGANLEENISGLVIRLKNKSYKPLPVLRVFISKGNGKMRPLGIAAYEDKFVQLAIKKILEAIYEPRFLENMYGFRPRRGCHNAIKAAYDRIYENKINYIVDADIKGFFDNMSHEWIMKFLGVYISDPNFLWLINKYLKAGVMTDGTLIDSISGSAQGSIISPVIANVYMHNVLMLWYKFIVLNGIKGKSFLVTYADDFIAGFQYKWEAEKYYIELKRRMAKFNLELEDSKSRLLEFGRFAEGNRKARGEGKPETFDFLGFTFYCGRSRRGYICTMLKTSRKKFRQKLKDTKRWLYKNRTMPVKLLIKLLNLKLIGHYRYYGISFNGKMIANFLHKVKQFLFKTLNRRSDKKSYSWDGFIEMLKYHPLAKPKIYYRLF
ncbi:group II intron reverse transcriptase/maturase [Clostridium botulinum]|uniref:group II intron reverse transcriptase/maturase n=1 Tax=Clostridium botulinum TaxID=1491 RepID=UPI0001F850DE|nr:group II intron reverse transcriptase/maturase [Clostridium botulinum]NFB16390.1 group II intron reverse transcriptase/maturase [Clostridium botulinum]NFB69173.1 group II intron reverse transcriptase/maturase [Clostridium botulinum]NFB96476.1 group II intron reverse transcriptase/maturase [Clostridium botulinum]NFC46413.1 group II intron reverse transcriptase/maturase [Clostridium botulinum]NFC57176.1 group II intron reverse transcriptase/maturase [Clostridium botulinum]